jgi:DNA-binding CsgD family transcriptional regulator
MAAPPRGPSWHKLRVALTTTISHALAELRRLARSAPRRAARPMEIAPLIARVIASCRTLAIENRAGGVAVRLQLGDGSNDCRMTCVIHDVPDTWPLTPSERFVAEQLCEGRTLAQISRLRGVSINTIKSQVRQIFRKLDVDTRVALVRRLCP